MSTSKCEVYVRPVLVGVVTGGRERLLFQPSCKMWGCTYCARINTILWRERIRHGVDYYQQHGWPDWSFVTITMSRKTRGFAYSVSIWSKCWSRLSTRIRREYPGIRYALLPERHKEGTLHVHALMSGKISNTWISKNAHKSGLGYMSNSKTMYSSSGAAWYATKYISKTLTVTEWPSRFRRIRTSQKWPLLENNEDYETIDAEWSFLASYDARKLEYLADGMTVETGVKHRVI